MSRRLTPAQEAHDEFKQQDQQPDLKHEAQNGRESAEPAAETSSAAPGVMAGKKCPECGAHAMIRKDGCDYCTHCGFVGSCG